MLPLALSLFLLLSAPPRPTVRVAGWEHLAPEYREQVGRGWRVVDASGAPVRMEKLP